MRSFALVGCLVLAACGAESAPTGGGSGETVDPVAACVQRGISYFREIGSYPTLKSAPNAGQAAEDVALERCQRTTTAF